MQGRGKGSGLGGISGVVRRGLINTVTLGQNPEEIGQKVLQVPGEEEPRQGGRRAPEFLGAEACVAGQSWRRGFWESQSNPSGAYKEASLNIPGQLFKEILPSHLYPQTLPHPGASFISFFLFLQTSSNKTKSCQGTP